MAQRKLGIGVAGTGAVAGAHIDNWQQVEGAEVVAVSSRRSEAAKQKIAQHSLSDATAYDDFHKLLADDRVDVVSLCTPHFAHPDETVAAAEAGKHIVIEKPVALNRADLQRMLKAVEKAGVLTSVCFELHWIGSFQNTRALVQRGDLGEVFYAEAAYNHGIKRGNPQFVWGHHTKEAGGSAFLTVGCHALDAVLHLMDDRAATVTALATTTSSNDEGYEYPANAAALMQMESGRLGKASVSLESENPYHFPVTVQGHKGTVVDQYYYSANLPAVTGWNELASDLPASGDPAHHPYKGQFEHLKHCIDNNERPENDLTAAAHVHDTCFAIDESIAQGGQPVHVETTTA
jgi:predicted dehydrogenase